MTKYMIAGSGKGRFVKSVSIKKAKRLEQEGKETYDNYQQAKLELESMKR